MKKKNEESIKPKMTSRSEDLDRSTFDSEVEIARQTEIHKRASKAAREYARAIAGEDNVRLIQIFQMAYRQAVSLIEAESTDYDAHSIANETISRFRPLENDAFRSNPLFVENTLELIKEDNAVFGGKETTGFPACVAVGDGMVWDCSGTLIAPNLVLTAQHCLDDGYVLVGPNIWTGDKVRVINRVLYNPYDNHTNLNDLKILILEKNIDVSPSPLASKEMIDGAKFVWVVGFGSDDMNGQGGSGIKRYAQVTIATHLCTVFDADEHRCNVGDEFVALDKEHDRDTCNRDSGGPAYVQVGDQYYLAGVTSRAVKDRRQRCGYGGIYVRVDVDKYRKWIGSIIESNQGA